MSWEADAWSAVISCWVGRGVGCAGQRNIIWQRFLGAGTAHVALSPEEDEASAQQALGSLRTALSRYPRDPDLRSLIEELIAGSERFWAMWEEGCSTVSRSMHKTIDRPDLGRLALDCDTLLLLDTDQSMIVYSAAASTREASALDRLRATGAEPMTSLSLEESALHASAVEPMARQAPSGGPPPRPAHAGRSLAYWRAHRSGRQCSRGRAGSPFSVHLRITLVVVFLLAGLTAGMLFA